MFGGWKSVGSGVLEFGAGDETWEHWVCVEHGGK